MYSSDSEATKKPSQKQTSSASIFARSLGNAFYPANVSMPNLRNHGSYNQLASQELNNNNTDDEPDDGRDVYHDFGEGLNYGPKMVRTGRQRKKLAARTKGGEFQTKRRKRRIYFCCISSEIDVQKLMDHLNEATDLLFGWQFELHNDVLHGYKAGVDEPISTVRSGALNISIGMGKQEEMELASTPVLNPLNVNDLLYNRVPDLPTSTEKQHDRIISNNLELPAARLVAVGSKEVFVYDFGAVVFWGFGRGEEAGLLKTIRLFVTKGLVADAEFQDGEDDMAFVTSPDEKSIVLANDVITLPDDTVPKQRLAVSFAIAQSSVLSIFEARIEQKVEEYKYIPEALAAYGKVHLSERQLGMMIGEVFVIRHDVNLHTEILGMIYTAVCKNKLCFHLFHLMIQTRPTSFGKKKALRQTIGWCNLKFIFLF